MTTFIDVATYRSAGPFSDTVIQDTADNLQSLTGSEIAAFTANGIVEIDSTDDELSLTVDQLFNLDSSVSFGPDDTVVLTDTGANIAAQLPSFFAKLDTIGVAAIAPTSDLALTVQQLFALNGVHIEDTGTVTLADTGANIAALTDGQLAALSGKNIDQIDAEPGDSLTLNALKAQAIANQSIAGTLHLVDTDLTISDTAANLATITAQQFAALDGLKTVDATDGDSAHPLKLSVAQYKALPAGALTSAVGDTVVLFDTGAHITGPTGLTLVELGALSANGIDIIDSTSTGLALSIAQYQALASVQLTGGDTVSLKDTSSALIAFNGGDYSILAGKNVDLLDSTDNVLTLTTTQFSTLGTVGLHPLDFVTITGTTAQLIGLGLATLAGKAVDEIDSSDDAITLSLSQLGNLGTVAINASDVLTIADTEANLEALDATAIGHLGDKGVDFLDATPAPNTLVFNVEQAKALLNNGIHLVSADDVTLLDSAANLGGLSAEQIGNLDNFGFDTIDVSDGAWSLSVAQFNALGGVALTDADTITILDVGAQLATLDFSTLATKHVDFLDASDGVLAITVDQYQDLGASVDLTDLDEVTLQDSPANLEALTSLQIGALAGDFIDVIHSTSDPLTLSIAKIDALGTVHLTLGDVVILADTKVNLEALIDTKLTAYAGAGRGVDRIDSTDDALNLNVAQVVAILHAGGITLTAADAVVLVDSGANIATIDASDIDNLEGINVDRIDANDDLLSLSVAQYLNLGAVALTGLDQVTLADTGVNIAAMSVAQLAGLAGKGVDLIDSTSVGDALSLTVLQYQALGAVDLTPSDQVTLADLGATLANLTPVEIGALAADGIDVINATDNVLSLTVAQYLALGAVNLTAGDTVTLRDTGAQIAGLSPVALAALAGNGIDRLDATDDVIVFNVAQSQALNSSQLTANDTIVINGTAASETITGFAFNDVIRGGAGNDLLNGLAGNDRLNGLTGNDTLSGGPGRDTLTGGGGNDKFLFASAPVPANVDRITDFSVVHDTILIENAVFGGVLGVLPTARFHAGTSAHDGNDRFIYNPNSGALYFDHDGNGAAVQKLIAVLHAHLALTHSDFLIV